MLLSYFRRAAAVALIALIPYAAGCDSAQPTIEAGGASAELAGDGEGDHSHDDHAAGGHAGHDHPPHGPHGGHLLSLSPGDAHVEWDHRSDQDQVIVYTTELGNAVTAVKMRYQIQGQEAKTFELEPAEEIAPHAYQISSPELLTAIQAGDAADVTLIVTGGGEEMSAEVEHHDH